MILTSLVVFLWDKATDIGGNIGAWLHPAITWTILTSQ